MRSKSIKQLILLVKAFGAIAPYFLVIVELSTPKQGSRSKEVPPPVIIIHGNNNNVVINENSGSVIIENKANTLTNK